MRQTEPGKPSSSRPLFLSWSATDNSADLLGYTFLFPLFIFSLRVLSSRQTDGEFLPAALLRPTGVFFQRFASPVASDFHLGLCPWRECLRVVFPRPKVPLGYFFRAFPRRKGPQEPGGDPDKISLHRSLFLFERVLLHFSPCLPPQPPPFVEQSETPSPKLTLFDHLVWSRKISVFPRFGPSGLTHV